MTNSPEILKTSNGRLSPGEPAAGVAPNPLGASPQGPSAHRPSGGAFSLAPASVDKLLGELAAGRAIVLADEDSPESTGAVVAAAQGFGLATAVLMMTHARGNVFGLALTAERCDQLRLTAQGFDPAGYSGTAYMTTVDARTGTTTGISAADRVRTVAVAIDPASRPDDLARPGHVFPLRGRPGGVLVRSGTTEAAIDLTRLAGLVPAAVVVHIHDDHGDLARGEVLADFAARHGLVVGTITDVIRHRLRFETLVRRLGVYPTVTPHGPFDVMVYASDLDPWPHVALVRGLPHAGPNTPLDEPVLVRVQSECLTGEVFGSRRCECGPQLQDALSQIAAAPRGVLVYLRQEGRGIGLANKLHAYRLQEQGLDTVEANSALGLPADRRDYGIGSQILRDLGLTRLRLLSNNPAKIHGLAGYGLEITERVPCRVPANPDNREYLRAKRDKMGHWLPEDL